MGTRRGFGSFVTWFLLGGDLIALFGYMAIADKTTVANIKKSGGNAQLAVPYLFTRNIFMEFFKPDASPKLETQVSRWASLVVKLGALYFAVELPYTFAINLQLLGGVWILQLFPMLVAGLFTRWFDRWALLTGRLAGMAFGTVAAYQSASLTATHWASSSDIELGHTVYIGVSAVLINVIIAVILTVILRAAKIPQGADGD